MGIDDYRRTIVLLLGALKMTVEQAIKAYTQLQEYMHPSNSPSADPERTRNSEAYRDEFIKIIRSVDMEVDSSMQHAATEVQAGQT
jgi:hypothetical protein